MDYSKILKDKFPEMVLSVAITNQDFGKTLSVELDTEDLEEVIKYTKLIDQYLEEENIYPQDMALEVLSRGEEITLDLNNLEKYLNKMVKLHFVKAVEKEQSMIAELLEVSDNQILVLWNQKGRMRKINIEKSNILNGEIYIKF
ncbi:ribosome assembly cofactor RimP [Mycoplasmopsis columboralis]|uniref:Uncharacterized BCR, YhbC family COG0779 n=1 Tax=Mycoplasmopsis columboralis TaxID=171282 RepID=A0A449B6Z7_9BACT|nr:ribosome assembly cofactor RimP [Mycoplasmopsis columboralis]VEU76345.1 Uncharacterised BCR, YhbC family COG0779 [Mycoplasmopsis columboralis]